MTCSVSGCGRVHVANGFCGAHYQRVKVHGHPCADRPLRVPHGHAAGRTSPTYDSWRAMRNRCTRPSARDYSYYGGRGITICERWKDFRNFLVDMGERPDWATGGVDRIDPDGNYEPSNCRWATRLEQTLNRRALQEVA